MNKDTFDILEKKAKAQGIDVFETGKNSAIFVMDSYSFRMENVATLVDVQNNLRTEVVFMDLEVDNAARSSMENLLNDLERFTDIDFEEVKSYDTEIKKVQKWGHEFVGVGTHKEQDFIFNYDTEKDKLTYVVPNGQSTAVIDADKDMVAESIFDAIENFEKQHGRSFVVEDISDVYLPTGNKNNSYQEIDIDDIL